MLVMLLLSLLLTAGAGEGAGGATTTVGVLSHHDPSAFTNRSCTHGSSRQQQACNLEIYVQAAAAARAEGVQLLVLPEAYGLGALDAATFWEPLLGRVNPCDVGDSRASPAQVALSCAAKQNGVALSANLFACRAATSDCPKAHRRITEVVFDQHGVIVRSYDKHHLFLTEEAHATAGPFAPSFFDMFGRRFGILICFEGVWPLLPGGTWAQTDTLVGRDNATDLVWSIGGAVPTELGGDVYKQRYAHAHGGAGVNVLVSEDSSEGAIGCSGHLHCPGTADHSIRSLPSYLGYTEARLAVRSAVLPALRPTQ